MTESQLPEFPSFVHLDPKHQTVLSDGLHQTHPYSDYNFISLWSWDHQNKLKLSQLNSNVVIRFQDYQNPDDFFYSFFGTNKVDETASTLLEYSKKRGNDELKLIAELVVENLNQPSLFVIKEDRDNFDYIVATKDMFELKSGQNKKRWSLNQFLKTHQGQLKIRELDIKNSRHVNQMLKVVENWRKQMSSRDSYSDSEVAAINKMLLKHSHIQTDNLHIIGIYLNEELKGFTITELLKGGVAMGHYKKADRFHRGLGPALEHFTAKTLLDKGVSRINHEQDLGLEGLRESKMSNRPVYFLKKYTISAR